jgi:ABC-type molybdate transport system permease subunit
MDVKVFSLMFAFAAGATLIAFVAGVWLAWISSNSKSPLAVIANIVLKLPIFFPPSLVALLLVLLTGDHNPPIVLWVYKTITSWQLAVLFGAVLALPVVYHCSLGAFRLIDGTQLDAARVYGIPQWRAALPLACRSLAQAAVCGFVRTFAESGILILISLGLMSIIGEDSDFPNFDGVTCALMLFFVILTTAVSVVTLMKSSCRRR